MLTALTLFATFVADDAKEIVVGIFDSYVQHETVRLVIDHEETSALFPGRYEQEFKWRKGGRFELLVTKPSDFKPEAGKIGVLLPSFYCDGKRVKVVQPDGATTEEPLGQPNVMPGWEVSGDVLVSWVMGTENKAFWLAPPAEFKTAWAMGEDCEWMGEEATNVTLKFEHSGSPQVSQLYISRDRKRYLGASYELNGKKAWVHYREQEFGLVLPETLGD